MQSISYSRGGSQEPLIKNSTLNYFSSYKSSELSLTNKFGKQVGLFQTTD